MKIIICGPILNENVEAMLAGCSPAAGKFLINLLEGIENNNIKTKKAIYIPYPLLKEEMYILEQFSNEDIVEIKSKYILKSILDFQKKILGEIDKDTWVIFYNMSYAYLGLKKKIEKKGANAIFLLADHTKSVEYTGIARKIYSKICENEIKKFDKIITLAEKPNIEFKRKSSQISICGGIKLANYKNIKLADGKQKLKVMYAGLLSEITGLDILLEAIKKYEFDDVEFWISGKGELENEVIKLSNEDKRVKFLGFLSQEKYIDSLKEVHIMVNPRNMKFEQNNNNFPSKVLEYLATGRIILSTKFSGYEKFSKNIILFDGTSESLAKSLKNIMNNYEFLNENYYMLNRELAKEFDWNNQARKIVKFIEMERYDGSSL